MQVLPEVGKGGKKGGAKGGKGRKMLLRPLPHLLVMNLPARWNAIDLGKFMETFGPVVDCLVTPTRVGKVLMESATALVKAHQTLNSPAAPLQEGCRLVLEIDDPGFDPTAPAPAPAPAPVPVPVQVPTIAALPPQPQQPQTVNLLNPGAAPQPGPAPAWANQLPQSDMPSGMIPVGSRPANFINPAKRPIEDAGTQQIKQQRLPQPQIPQQQPPPQQPAVGVPLQPMGGQPAGAGGNISVLLAQQQQKNMQLLQLLQAAGGASNLSSLVQRVQQQQQQPVTPGLGDQGGQKPIEQQPAPRTKYFVAVGNNYQEIRSSLDSDLWRTDVHIGAKWDNLIRQGYKIYLLFIVKDSEIFSGYASITGPSRRRLATDQVPADWVRVTRVLWEHAGCVRRSDIEHLRSYSNSPLTSCVNDEELPPEAGEQLCQLVDLTGNANSGQQPQQQQPPPQQPLQQQQHQQHHQQHHLQQPQQHQQQHQHQHQQQHHLQQPQQHQQQHHHQHHHQQPQQHHHQQHHQQPQQQQQQPPQQQQQLILDPIPQPQQHHQQQQQRPVQGNNLLPATSTGDVSSALNLASLSSTFDDYINNPQGFDTSQIIGS
eukprot:TRINITY_DN3790_c2_g3_i2.p1 TRINITY_DN3790_c2_g3~~TRINITY_DN3790_c2_g3_i2.p1  ORF type:complete len:597 (+),score=180.98 TRINITY_DN3790_c2_g3_i2:37-1827(+)